jgi:serine/threonine protein kinase
MAELLTKKELFRGSSTIDCLLNICRVVGSKELRKVKEDEHLIRLLPIIKGTSLSEHLQGAGCPLLVDLLEKMLRVRADERARAVQVLVHPFFDELRDEPTFHEIVREKLDISDFFTFSPGTPSPTQPSCATAKSTAPNSSPSGSATASTSTPPLSDTPAL